MLKMGLAKNASLDNLRFTTDLKAAVKDADLIQENVPEVESIKDSVLKEIDFMRNRLLLLVQVHLVLYQLNCKNLKNPERLVVAHPFHPVYILPLVEIVPGQSTSEETIIKAEEIYENIGMDVLHVRNEIEGHIADRQWRHYGENLYILLMMVLRQQKK